LIVANASLVESESSAGPYVGFVQNLIFNFIEVSDTLIYAITGNEMLLNTVDGDVGIISYYDFYLGIISILLLRILKSSRRDPECEACGS
jgi:hypothetical protein